MALQVIFCLFLLQKKRGNLSCHSWNKLKVSLWMVSKPSSLSVLQINCGTANSRSLSVAHGSVQQQEEQGMTAKYFTNWAQVSAESEPPLCSKTTPGSREEVSCGYRHVPGKAQRKQVLVCPWKGRWCRPGLHDRAQVRTWATAGNLLGAYRASPRTQVPSVPSEKYWVLSMFSAK